jgi:hypothetical protein
MTWTLIGEFGGGTDLVASASTVYKGPSGPAVERYTGIPHQWETLYEDGEEPAHSIVVAGEALYRLDKSGLLFQHETGQTWDHLDAPEAIAFAWPAGDALILRDEHTAAWIRTATGDWTRIDAAVGDDRSYAAAGGVLYRLNPDGTVWQYNGTPLTGWRRIREAGSDVVDLAGGGDLPIARRSGDEYLWQIRTDGSRPVKIGDASGYQSMSAWGDKVIFAHENGPILRYTGDPATGWRPLPAHPEGDRVTDVVTGPNTVYTMGRGTIHELCL